MRLALCVTWCVNKNDLRPNSAVVSLILKWCFPVCSSSRSLAAAAQTPSAPMACHLCIYSCNTSSTFWFHLKFVNWIQRGRVKWSPFMCGAKMNAFFPHHIWVLPVPYVYSCLIRFLCCNFYQLYTPQFQNMNANGLEKWMEQKQVKTKTKTPKY